MIDDHAVERKLDMRRRTRARIAGWLGTLLLGVAALLALAPVAGAAQPTGKVRMGHLSPSTAAVDATLIGPEGPSSTTQRVAGGVGYGGITGYLALVPGRYVVELRPAGSAPASAPAVTAGLQVVPDTAQSLFFMDNGPLNTVRGDLVTDDTTAPAPSTGAVRLVQGATDLPPVQVSAIDGPRLATNLVYGTVTDYSTVAAKTWQVVISAGGTTKTVALPVGGGSVNTVVVKRDAAGGLAVVPVSDLAGLPVGIAPTPSAVKQSAPAGAPQAPTSAQTPKSATAPVPRGGVPAGAGGLDEGGSGLMPLVLALLGAPLLAYAVSAGRARRQG